MRTEQAWEACFDELAFNDYSIVDNFFEVSVYEQLERYFEIIQEKGLFSKAAIGASGDAVVINEIRGDYTYWLERTIDLELNPIFEALDELKQMINRYCFLSLSSYEFHLAHYPKGSFYKKHLDQFAERNNRLVSVVIYLNRNWKSGDGGELKVYPADRVSVIIPPIANRFVIFKSDVLFHEVLPANISRKSLTGWMQYQPTPLITVRH